MNISCSAVPVESAHSMGIGERYQGPIRRIFERLRLAHPRAPKDLLPDLSVKTCNDLMGVDSLVPTLLVYGVYPRLPLKDAANDDVFTNNFFTFIWSFNFWFWWSLNWSYCAPVRKDANDHYRPRRVFTACRRHAPQTAQSVQSATHPTDLA
jgi:hypothetical protein